MPKKLLSVEFKEELTQLVGSLKQHTFYTILRIPVNASREDVKKAYFILTKSYHPDQFYGEDLGEYKAHLEAIFRSITRAHDVLTDPVKREKYNRYLQQKNDLRGMESSAVKGLSEVREHILRKTGIMPSISMTGEDGAAEPAEPETPPASQPLPEKTFDSSKLDAASPKHKLWKKRRLMSLLNIQAARVEDKKVSKEAGSKVQEMLRSAEEAEKAENYMGAMNALQVAIVMDPDNQDLHDRFKASLRKMAPQLGQKYFSMGASEEDFGDMNAAADSFQKAASYCPENAEYNFRHAGALYNGDGDLHKAYEAIRKAITLHSNDASYYLLFAKICQKAGMAKSAQGALKTCLKIDSKNKEALQLLKGL